MSKFSCFGTLAHIILKNWSVTFLYVGMNDDTNQLGKNGLDGIAKGHFSRSERSKFVHFLPF